MICIILAAGYATRMYPLTRSFPKPLLDVQGKTILDCLIDDIDHIPHIERILVVTNHRFYKQFLTWKAKRNSRTPISIIDDGSTDNQSRLGAVMDIRLAFSSLSTPQDILIAAGDNLLEFSLAPFVQFFQQTEHSAVMCYREPLSEKQRKTGIITVDGSNLITSFEEKPQIPKSDLAVPPFYLYTENDIQRIDDAIADSCGTDAPGSLAKWLSQHSSVYAWPMPGKRFDIGSLDGYEQVKLGYKPR